MSFPILTPSVLLPFFILPFLPIPANLQKLGLTIIVDSYDSCTQDVNDNTNKTKQF